MSKQVIVKPNEQKSKLNVESYFVGFLATELTKPDKNPNFWSFTGLADLQSWTPSM